MGLEHTVNKQKVIEAMDRREIEDSGELADLIVGGNNCEYLLAYDNALEVFEVNGLNHLWVRPVIMEGMNRHEKKMVKKPN